MGTLALVALLGTGGAAYQAIASEIDQRRYPPPGRLVDVGGYRLHLNAMGADKGAPTVILDAGAQSASFQWSWVQPEVAESARVVAYDRPGTWWSASPPAPIDARELADDLHEALDAIDAEGPYVVVGHSMGSLSARAFAERHPGEVVGAVLVDPRNLSLHEDFPEAFPEANVSADPPLQQRIMPVGARLGVMRLTDPLGEYAAQMPPRQAAEARAYSASNKLYGGTWDDVLLAESAVPSLRDGESFGGEPLVVLSAGAPDDQGLSRRGARQVHQDAFRDGCEHLLARRAPCVRGSRPLQHRHRPPAC